MIAPTPAVETKGNVLVIDDESDIRESLEVLLGSEGYAVDLAQNAAEGLHKMESRGYDLVLLDLMMPRVNGWEVCEQLSAEPELAARHAVVVMSAAIEPGARFPEFVRAALLKPFTLSTALSLVAALSLEPGLEPDAAVAQRAGEFAAHP